MPSRAASVQMRIRRGSLAGSALKAGLYLLAAILAGRPGEDGDALVRAVRFGDRLVGVTARHAV
jgi:hypothetical protein